MQLCQDRLQGGGDESLGLMGRDDDRNIRPLCLHQALILLSSSATPLRIRENYRDRYRYGSPDRLCGPCPAASVAGRPVVPRHADISPGNADDGDHVERPTVLAPAPGWSHRPDAA